ncbi:MAG: dTMP kinase [Candidatus Micrarchaeia archaeon]
MRGKLVCFEGIDGAGKETQVKLLLKFLRGKAVVFKYPDAKSAFGRVIDAFLKRKVELNPFSQFLIYLMDIAKDQRRVEEEVARGSVVILNRYVFSTVAYQCSKGVSFKKGVEMVESMNLLKPDLVVLLDVSPEVSRERKRRQKRMDRHEADAELLGKVRGNYLKLMRRRFLARKWVRVNAEREPEKVSEDVKGLIVQLLKK